MRGDEGGSAFAAAAAKGLLELKRCAFCAGERKEPVEEGERFGERLGV